MSEQSDEHHTAIYPSIHFSGNARTIIGNVYSSGGLPLFDANRRRRKLSLLSSLSDVRQQEAECVIAISSELSVLLLRDFEDVKSSLNGFRKVESRLGKYTKQINVGRAIFQHTLLTLLSPHAGHEQAQAMLSNQDHFMWLDGSFTNYLRRLFGTHIEAVHNVLELISIDLDAMASFSRKCFEMRDDSGQSDKLSTLQQIRSKFKTAVNCAIHEDKVAEHLQSLRQNTEDFRTLLSQCIPQQESSNTSKPSEQTRLRIGKYKRVQEAAANFYHAFSLACTQHSKHRGHLKILTDCARPSHVQFTLLLEQTGFLVSSSKILPPLRLTIESQVTGTLTDMHKSTAGVLQSLALHKKRLRDVDSFAEFERRNCMKQNVPNRKKVVGFADHPFSALRIQDASTDDFPNFCTNSNLCTHLGTVLQQGCRSDTPLGYLDSHGCSKHLIYLASRTQTVSLSPEGRDSVTSFKALCSRTDRQLSRVEKIALAKQLALAVLQYQATPFLDESWDSDNLLVECNEATPMMISSGTYRHADFDAYLQVSINGPDESKDVAFDSCSRTLVRNRSLFTFGLMLLQLAYKTPVREMQTSHDVDPTGNVYNTDYFTAMRMQQNVSVEMGLEYSEIVRKCLQCDFGHGSDLAAPKLQEGFYEDVIQKLEDLEAKFRAIGL